ncbi:MAG: hypothetical protein LBJ00_10915 [Planctomycetaceae bacterium]|nr:hypothetical protein [Planctomycetaceae bacterium]
MPENNAKKKRKNEIKKKEKIDSFVLYSSCFKIPEAAANLQRRALGKRSIVKRLFKGEVYRPYRLRYTNYFQND